MGKSVYTLSQQKYSIKLWGWLASERWKLSAFITKGIYRFRYFQCLPVFIIRPTIMLWRVSSVRLSVRSSVRLSVNIWLLTGVITCRITFNFADIIHLVWPIHDAGNEPWSSSNMRILTQLLIFTCWSFLKPFCKLEYISLAMGPTDTSVIPPEFVFSWKCTRWWSKQNENDTNYFISTPFRPKGYCRCLRLFVRPSLTFTLTVR